MMDAKLFLEYTYGNIFGTTHRELLLFYENINNSIVSKVSIDFLEMMNDDENLIKENIYSIINILRKNKKNITTYISINFLENDLHFSDDQIKSYCFE